MKNSYLLTCSILCFFNGIIMPAESSSEQPSNVPSLIDLCLQAMAYRSDLQEYSIAGKLSSEATAENLSRALTTEGIPAYITTDEKRLRSAVEVPQRRQRKISKYFAPQLDGTLDWTEAAITDGYVPIPIHSSEIIAWRLPGIIENARANDVMLDECELVLNNQPRNDDPYTNHIEHLDRLSLLQNTINAHFRQLISSAQSEHLKSSYGARRDALRTIVDNALTLTKHRMETLIAQRLIMQEICETYNIRDRLAQIEAEEALSEAEDRAALEAEQALQAAEAALRDEERIRRDAEARAAREEGERRIEQLANANCCARMLSRFNKFLHDIF